MPELKLGTKYECYSCGTKFYDLGKSSPTCPKCGADQRDAASAESPAVSQSSRRKRKAEVVPKAIDVDDEVPIEDLPDDEIVAAELDGEIDAADEEEDFDDDEA